jgi:hypothetical protein
MELRGLILRQNINGKKLEFVHNLLKSRPDSFIQIISTQVQVFIYLYTELSAILNQLSVDIGKITSKLDEKIDSFYEDPYSPLNLILDNGDSIISSEKVAPKIAKAIIAISRNLDHAYKKISGKEHVDIFPKLDKFSKIDLKAATSAVSQVKYHSAHKDKLIGSKNVICNFTDLPKAEADKILSNISKFNSINFKDPSDKDSRKIIKDLQNDYFKLLSVLIFKYFNEDFNVPLPVKLFLYFGFIDETLLTDEEIDQYVILCRCLINRQS